MRLEKALQDIRLNPILLYWPFHFGTAFFVKHRRRENLIFAVIQEPPAAVRPIGQTLALCRECANFPKAYFRHILKPAFCGIDKEHLRHQGDDWG